MNKCTRFHFWFEKYTVYFLIDFHYKGVVQNESEFFKEDKGFT